MFRLSALLLASAAPPAAALQAPGPAPVSGAPEVLATDSGSRLAQLLRNGPPSSGSERRDGLRRWAEALRMGVSAASRPSGESGLPAAGAAGAVLSSRGPAGAGGGGPPVGSYLDWVSKTMNSSAAQNNSQVQQLLAALPGGAQALRDPAALQKFFSPRMLKVMQGSLSSGLPAVAESRDAAGRTTLDIGDDIVVKVFHAGDNRTFPKEGDQVALQYVGFLKDGSRCDSRPLVFRVGSDDAIPGLDRAVRHMSLGERALVRIPRDMLRPMMPSGPCPEEDTLVFDLDLRHVNATGAPAARDSAH